MNTRRIMSLLLAAATTLLIGAGCSTSKIGAESSGPEAWKKTAPPADYIEQAKAHNAAAPPSGGPPPAPPATP